MPFSYTFTFPSPTTVLSLHFFPILTLLYPSSANPPQYLPSPFFSHPCRFSPRLSPHPSSVSHFHFSQSVLPLMFLWSFWHKLLQSRNVTACNTMRNWRWEVRGHLETMESKVRQETIKGREGCNKGRKWQRKLRSRRREWKKAKKWKKENELYTDRELKKSKLGSEKEKRTRRRKEN